MINILPVTYLLLLGSSFLHAYWNFLLKKSPKKDSALLGILTLAALLALTLMLVTQRFSLGHGVGLYWGVAAGLFEGAYLVSLTRNLKIAPLGLSYAVMRGGAMILVWLVSARFLGESVTLPHIFATCLVALGILGVSYDRRQSHLNFWLFRWALSGAVFIAGYHICYGQALKHGADPFPLFALSLLLSLPFIYGQNYRTPAAQILASWKQNQKTIMAGGVLAYLSFMFFLVGLQHAEAGYAITLRNSSIVFAQLLARGMGEKLSRLQLAAFVMLTLGVVLLGLSL